MILPSALSILNTSLRNPAAAGQARIKVGGFGRRADNEGALIVKAAIRRQNMQVWIEILEITKALDGNNGTGSGIVIGYNLSQI